jgi:hypothetical protein
MENMIMKKIATVISAVTIAVASTAVSAWGWGDNGYNNGYQNGNGNGYGDGAGDFDGDFGFSMNMSGRGHGRGQGNGYNGYNGNNGYGYAPYGYGYAPYGAAPVQPAVELTEEEKKVIADQQAKYVEDMQKAQQQAQQQAAEFYANQRAPMTDMRTQMMEQHQARVAEMDARRAEFKKASDARRAEFEAARKARMQEISSKTEKTRVEADTGA